MNESKLKKSKLEEEMDQFEAKVSKEWLELDAQFEEELRKAVEQDFPEEADQLLRRSEKPQNGLNK